MTTADPRPSLLAAEARPDPSAAGQLLADARSRDLLHEPPRVLADMPAAVLLVDGGSGQVTYANLGARELAPGLTLPVPMKEWIQAARLTAPDRLSYPEDASPLARVAAGQHLAGELVAVDRGPGEHERARPLWATGFPLADVPIQGATGLVILLDLSADVGRAEVADAVQALRERAVIATDISFTISDPSKPDNPLVWVNPAFTRVTGYEAHEALGRNCRFLQGPDTDPGTVAEMRAAQREQRPTAVTVLNYRRNGTAFWNEVSISPVFDGDGTLTHFVGVQADVSSRVSMEQERERAYAAERAARAEAERAQARLALLAEATTLLSATLDLDVAMDRLANLTVPVLADWCSVELLDDSALRYRLAVAAVDEDGADRLRRADALQPRHRGPATAASRVLAGGEPVLVPVVDDDYLRGVAYDDEQFALYQGLRTRSAMVLPLRARRQTLGTITLATTAHSERQFTEADLELAKDLTRRAALAVDNARLYTREHQVAVALQRSLLPTLPEIPGLSVAARYVASTEGSQVGGDWYDVLKLPDGTVGLAIGDVMGHDISAAASMGQLRSVLRSYAWEGDRAAAVLDRLDVLVQALEMAQLATAVYGRLEPEAGGWTLRYANAGHLPPLLRLPDGSTRFLEGGRSMLLGAPAGDRREEGSESLPAGATLLLYTDGLVERRDRGLDEGLEWLRAAVEATPRSADPEELCDAVLPERGQDLDDDVAVLAVCLEPSERPGPS